MCKLCQITPPGASVKERLTTWFSTTFDEHFRGGSGRGDPPPCCPHLCYNLAMANVQSIPVVFAFNADYALPASVAIQSLLASKRPETAYDIIVLHTGLPERMKRKMETIATIRWIEADTARFAHFPKGWGGTETWLRLLLAELLPEHDKVIWSDVDVLFCDDLSDVFSLDLGPAEWAGVAMEADGAPYRQHNSWGRHARIYIPSLMVANLERWRATGFLARCERVVSEYGSRLTMCDLDVLNIAAEKIAPLPLAFCVLERLKFGADMTKAREYAPLRSVYTDDELRDACRHPAILHFAGPTVKVWLRAPWRMPACYREAMLRSPFGGQIREWTWIIRTTIQLIRWFAAWLCGPASRRPRARRHFGIYRRSLAGAIGLTKLASDSLWQPTEQTKG